jgi:thiamine biosynthesis lipoprotein
MYSFAALTRFVLAPFRARIEPVTKTEKIMGSFATMTAYGVGVAPAIDAAFERMRAIEAQVGRDEGSDISRINAGASQEALPVRPDTLEMLLRAKRYWSLSERAFDITVGPLVELWDFGFDGVGRLPSPGEIAGAIGRVGSDKLEVDAERRSVCLKEPGMSITVAGVAKGYAVEEAAAELRARGVKRAVVNGGASSIKVIGRRPFGRRWRVGIEHPRREGRLVGVVRLKSGQSIGTSADERRFFVEGGRRYSHILDPRTGRPTEAGVAQVSVIGDDAVETEALAKALFLQDRDWSLQLLEERGLEAIFADTQGRVESTQGVKLSR